MRLPHLQVQMVPLVVPEHHLVEQRRQLGQQRQARQRPPRPRVRPGGGAVRRRARRRRAEGGRQAAREQVLQHEGPEGGQRGIGRDQHVLRRLG